MPYRGPMANQTPDVDAQDVPLTVPVRRQLPDGTYGTVEITPEEWARTEGRRTRGVHHQEVTRA